MKKTLIILLCMVMLMSLFVMESGTAAQKYAGKTLTVLYMSSVYAEAAKKVAAEFKKQTGANVEVVDFPYVTLHEKEVLDLSSNTGAYDVISVACQWDGELAPFLTPLAPYIKKSKYDLKDIIPNVLSQAGQWNGKITGIPSANTPYTLAYRTDLVKTVPKTWDEYLELCKKLTDKSKGMYGVSIPGVKEQFSSLFYIRMWSMGGAWADENWKPAINSPEARKALQHCKELFNYADPAAPSWGLAESINGFLQGKAAFCESWPTLGITLDGDNPEKSKIVGKWAIAPFPHDKTGLTNLSAWDLSIPQASKNKDLAWEWINFYTSKKNQNAFYKDFAICSPRISFWNQPEIKTSKIASFRTALDTAIIWWRLPASTEVDKGLGIAAGQYCSGQADLESTIKLMEQTVADALKQSPPPAGVKNTNH